jgi:ABC-type transport system involved in multi-copper enzyme maturation permease subunit
MNALVKKEIRLLLPSWLAVLSLVILLPWFWKDSDATFAWMPPLIFFGMILVGMDSFGREFSLGTFQSLLSQPITRRQIWRIKITVLFFAAALIFAAYFASFELLFHQALKIPVWTFNPELIRSDIRSDFHHAMFGSVVATLIALGGGLWTVLLFRQIAAAFWITFLVPAGLAMTIVFFLPAKLADNDHIVIPLLYSVAGLYIVWGFWLAHRLFHRAQDVAWTGGIISFSTWRYFEAGSKSSISLRRRKPITALLKKEFQLQSISLFCACALFVLHIAIILMRKIHGNFERNSLFSTASEFFWALWLIMPVVIGSMAVAEERKLGVAEGQLCLPVSRHVQFTVKLLLTIFLGVLLGGVMPLFVEFCAAHLGAPNSLFELKFKDSGNLPQILVAVLFLPGLILASFFASTLARNFLQALGFAIVTTLGWSIFFHFISYERIAFGVTLWRSGLPVLIAFPMLAVTMFWLAWWNFADYHENRRLWRRNIPGLTMALIFIVASSTALYNRVWEVFEPAEPAHDPAKLSLSNPPTLHSEGGADNLLVRLPDGRVWFDYVSYNFSYDPNRWEWLWRTFINPMPKSSGPQQFISGSNWVYATARRVNTWVENTGGGAYNTHVVGYWETVGIQPDGTLWVSDKSNPKVWTADRLTRFGNETNWQKVVQSYRLTSVLLLKKDGTLWLWGTNYFDLSYWPQNWPGLRAFEPYQIGTNSDWSDIFSDNGYLARKTDGSVWSIWRNYKSFKEEVSHETDFDQILLQTLSTAYGGELGAYIRKDGTLWIYDELDDHDNKFYVQKFKALQSGRETNWVSVAVTWDTMVALKSDGSLWRWERKNHSFAVDFTATPTRLGIHDDWVAITNAGGGVVALAADGSLWFWPYREFYEYQYPLPLLKLPKPPEFLGNIFSSTR